MCSLVLYVRAWVMDTNRKKLFRLGQLRSSKMIALECSFWRSQTGANLCGTVLKLSQSEHACHALPMWNFCFQDVSLGQADSDLNWLHMCAQCVHWAVLGKPATGGRASFKSSEIQLLLRLGKRASSSLLSLQIMEHWLDFNASENLFSPSWKHHKYYYIVLCLVHLDVQTLTVPKWDS